VEAEHKLEESATWSQTRVNRDFEPLGDPDEMLDKITATGQENWGRFKESVADALYR
jgi:hypothetical protein